MVPTSAQDNVQEPSDKNNSVTMSLEELQALIDARLREKELADNPPPRVLTPHEQLESYIALARASENAEKALPSSSGRTHDAVIAALETVAAILSGKAGDN